jgi:hypothetical protein
LVLLKDAVTNAPATGDMYIMDGANLVIPNSASGPAGITGVIFKQDTDPNVSLLLANRFISNPGVNNVFIGLGRMN